MFKNLIIRKTVAAFMLLMFAFSITPTIVLHNWFANHTDTYKKTGNSDTEQLCNKTFNCHCDNIVAQSPFTEPENFITRTPLLIFADIISVNPVHLPISPTIFHALRGPPEV